MFRFKPVLYTKHHATKFAQNMAFIFANIFWLILGVKRACICYFLHFFDVWIFDLVPTITPISMVSAKVVEALVALETEIFFFVANETEMAHGGILHILNILIY